MERALSQDERIRRAEEIYARRQNLRERTKRATVNISSQTKNFRLLKRVILQAVICVLIYFIFYLINTTNYSFSEVTLNKTEELITKDVDFIAIYNNIFNSISNYISGLFGKNGNTEEENSSTAEGESAENDESVENSDNVEKENTEGAETKQDTNESIALNTNEEDTDQEEIAEVEISETDRIKQKYSFVLPVIR